MIQDDLKYMYTKFQASTRKFLDRTSILVF